MAGEGEALLGVGVVGDPAPCVVLRMTDSAATRELWPHKFDLLYKARAAPLEFVFF